MNKLPLTVLSGLSGAGEATLPNYVLNLKTLVEHARMRGRSGLTFRVSVNEATNVSSHTAFRGVKERSTEVSG